MCCYYCGKSVSPWYKGMPKGGQTGSLSRQGGGGGGNKPKTQSCPHCKVRKYIRLKSLRSYLLDTLLFIDPILSFSEASAQMCSMPGVHGNRKWLSSG